MTRTASKSASPEALSELTPREDRDPRARGGGALESRDRRTVVLSDETVKTHVSHVLRKLGLRDRAQAVVVAYETGLVVPRA
jgi:FMN phosphatase YigB (HAD superfamily)